MSLLFPEHIRIGLGSSYAVLARVKGGKVTHWQMQTWHPASAAPLWQQALASVNAWLAELSPRGARIAATLSPELAPLHLLPWRDDVTGAEQQGLLAAAHFRRIYGAAIDHWKTSIQPSGYGNPWLASATDERLLQGLSEQIRSVGATLASVTPLPISLFNALRQRLAASACWLVVPELECLTALHWRDGQWQLLRTLPIAALQREPLADLLLRETRLAGLPDIPATIYAAAAGSSAAGLDSAAITLDPGWHCAPAVAPGSPVHLLGGRA